MLGKLFKHDFSSTAKPLLLFSVIVLAVSGAGAGLKYVLDLPVLNGDNLYSIRFVITMLIIACYFALFAYFILMLILIVIRYYRNLFTEEGYLTFTLPTTTGKILLSKFLSAYLTMFIALIVAAGGLAILTFIFPSKLFGITLHHIQPN